MTTMEEVKRQIDALPHKYVFYTKKEIKYLPEILVQGEEIRALTSGFNENRTVLAVCTNRRILFIDKGFFFGLKQWQIALDRVQSIDGDYTIGFGTIRVWDGAAPISLNMVWASSIDPFIKTVRQAVDDFRRLAFQEVTNAAHQQRAATAAAPAAVDVASQIEKLAQLKDAGHLTEAEFQHQKHKLLTS